MKKMKTNFKLNNKNIEFNSNIQYDFQRQIFKSPTCQEKTLDDVHCQDVYFELPASSKTKNSQA